MKKLFSILLFLFFLTNLLFLEAKAEIVVYNPNTKIFHSMNCSSAIRCKSCIKIDKKTAIAKGGRACKKCGG